MKKHIIISPEGGDFSMDLMFAGLVRKFGRDNVIDYPARKKHRQGKPILIGDHERDYGAERRSLCYVDGCESLKEWSRALIREQILSANIETIFLDETAESFVLFKELTSGLLMFGKSFPKIVVIAGHDRFRGDPLSVINAYHKKAFLFIDDWKAEYEKLPNTYLTNLSCNFDHLWNVENRDKYLADKKYDLCFIGYNSNPIRKYVIDHVKEKWGHLNNCIIFEERQDRFDMFVRHDEMFRMMAQSKICINLPGASSGGRALRFYEIPYVGSYMLSWHFDAKLLKPLQDKYVKTLHEFDSKVESMLEDEHMREWCAKVQHEHCMKYDTVDARIDGIFGVINGQAAAI